MVSRKLITALMVSGLLVSAGGAGATGVCIGDPRACDGGGRGGGGGGSTSPFANIVLDISNGDDEFPGQQEARTSGEGSSEQQGKEEGQKGVSEGDTCVFTIHRSGPTNKSASVDWKTKDGTAIASDGKGPGDYFREAGTAFFKPGQRDAFVFIQTIFDGQTEPDEHFFVILKNPSKSVIDDKKGKCTIFANSGGD